MKICTFIFALLIITSTQHIKSQGVSFAKPVDISNGSVAGVTSLDAADLNQDGLVDVIVLEGGKHAEKPTYAWFEQTANAVWIRHELGNTSLLDSFLGSAKCSDIDGDLDIDIILTSDNHAKGPIKVFIFENPGKHQVTKPWKLKLVQSIDGFHANDMRIADMDNNDKSDIVIRHKNPNSIKILFQKNHNDWSMKSLNTEKLGNEGLAVGHLNNDNILDISVNGYWFRAPNEPINGQYLLFTIDPVYTTINPNTKEDIGDINGDGLNDVIISPAEAYYNGNNHVLAWYQASSTPEIENTWIKHVIRDEYNHGHSVKLVDIDLDNDLDVISGKAWAPKQVIIFFNNQSDFSKSYLVIEGNGIYSGAFMDMDNDGDIDMVGEDTYSGESRPWYYENLLLQSDK